MKGTVEEDRWLGNLYSFPTILHARASLSFDINPSSLQKALVSALSLLRENPVSRKISLADRDGYSDGTAQFKVGIGNGEAFDILDVREVERVLHHIENRGPFDSLDLALHIKYRIDDGLRHKVHQDHYMVRLVFQPGRLEALIHHQKGIRRFDPSELLHLIVHRLNTELIRERLPSIKVDHVTST